MIAFHDLEDLKPDPGPRCPYCLNGEMVVAEDSPDRVIFCCPNCKQLALPHQLLNPVASKRDAMIMVGVVSVSLFGLFLFFLLALAYFIR